MTGRLRGNLPDDATDEIVWRVGRYRRLSQETQHGQWTYAAVRKGAPAMLWWLLSSDSFVQEKNEMSEERPSSRSPSAAPPSPQMQRSQAGNKTTRLAQVWQRKVQQVRNLEQSLRDAREALGAAEQELAIHLAPKNMRLEETIGMWVMFDDCEKLLIVKRTSRSDGYSYRVFVRDTDP